jgi:hypothetical protein
VPPVQRLMWRAPCTLLLLLLLLLSCAHDVM